MVLVRFGAMDKTAPRLDPQGKPTRRLGVNGRTMIFFVLLFGATAVFQFAAARRPPQRGTTARYVRPLPTIASHHFTISAL
jgi:hypothetical protein